MKAVDGLVWTATTLKPLRYGLKAGLARNSLTDATKWNHNGSNMDGEYRAHNFDTEEYS